MAAITRKNLNIDLSDLKESCVRRLLREVVSGDMDMSKPSHAKSDGSCPSCSADRDDDDDDYEGDEESESDKLVRLQQETRGKPADLPVTEEDFSEGALRKAVAKAMPKAKKAKS